MQNKSAATKKRYAVYHSLNPVNMRFPDGDHWAPRDSEHFLHVATVVEESPEDVFYLTINYLDDEFWTDLPEVKWRRSRAIRSTSVGDVIYLPAEKRTWLVLKEGFEDISSAPGSFWERARTFLQLAADRLRKEYSTFFRKEASS